MTALDILVKLIKESEGCRLRSYQDSGDKWTIGYGYTHGVTSHMQWTQEQADKALISEAQKALEQALKASPVLKNETLQRQAAIADFIYNIGLGDAKHGYLSSTLKLRVDQKNWPSACYEIKKWNKCAGIVQNGLVIRRDKEAQLLIS